MMYAHVSGTERVEFTQTVCRRLSKQCEHKGDRTSPESVRISASSARISKAVQSGSDLIDVSHLVRGTVSAWLPILTALMNRSRKEKHLLSCHVWGKYSRIQVTKENMPNRKKGTHSSTLTYSWSGSLPLLMLRKKFQPTSKNARMLTNHLVASIFQQGNTRFFSYKGLFKTACVIDLGFFVLSFFLDQKLRNSTSKGLRRSQMRQLTTVKCRFRVKLKSWSMRSSRTSRANYLLPHHVTFTCLQQSHM